MLKVGAGVILIENGKVLLVRGPSTGYGLWTQPRGLWEEGETTKETAIRECMEEIGLKVEITGIIAAIDLRIHRGDQTEQELFLSYSGRIIGSSQMEPQTEITEVKWFTVEEALKRVDVSTSTKVGISMATGKELKVDLRVTVKDTVWEVIPYNCRKSNPD